MSPVPSIASSSSIGASQSVMCTMTGSPTALPTTSARLIGSKPLLPVTLAPPCLTFSPTITSGKREIAVAAASTSSRPSSNDSPTGNEARPIVEIFRKAKTLVREAFTISCRNPSIVLAPASPALTIVVTPV